MTSPLEWRAEDQQATGASVAPLSLVNNPGESFALDNQWQLFKSVGPTQPANWVKSGNQLTHKKGLGVMMRLGWSPQHRGYPLIINILDVR